MKKQMVNGTLAILLAILTGCSSSPTSSSNANSQSVQKPKSLVIAAFGGNFEKGMKETIIPAFEKKYNTKITYITGASADTLSKVKAQKDKPQIDVAILDDGPSAMGKTQGLFAPIDPKKVTNLTNVIDIAKDSDNIGVGVGVIATGIAYNTKTFAENGWNPPTSWNDLSKPEFKGKLVLPSFSGTYGVHMMVMEAKANGGSETNVEPGFAKMKEVAKNAITFDTTGDVSNFFLQGQALASVWGTSRVYTLKSQNFPIEFVYPKEGAVAVIPMGNIVKNAPNEELGQEFINFMLSDEAQQTLSKTVYYGPVNKTVKLEGDVARQVVYGQENIDKLVKVDWKTINENRSAWAERVNKEIEIAH